MDGRVAPRDALEDCPDRAAGLGSAMLRSGVKIGVVWPRAAKDIPSCSDGNRCGRGADDE